MTGSGDLVCKYNIATGAITITVPPEIYEPIGNIILNFCKILGPWVVANAVPILIGAGVTAVVVGGIVYFYRRSG